MPNSVAGLMGVGEFARLPDAALAWVTPDGVVELLGFPSRQFEAIDLSPDGRRVAASRIEGGTYGLWLYDIARQTEEKVEAPGSNFGPRWSPAGNFVTFTGMRSGHFDVWTLSLTGGSKLFYRRGEELVAVT